jgi:glycosyltransferase involved in cell wall biosynthesis
MAPDDRRRGTAVTVEVPTPPSPAMRSLVVADTFPWPVGSGSAMRLIMVLQALAALGPVDLFAMVDPTRTQHCTLPNDGPPVTRFLTVRRSSISGRRRLINSIRTGRPLAVSGRDDRKARTQLREWARQPYDFLWCDTPATWLAVRPTIKAPTVVDLDDLEGDKVLARLALRPPTRSPGARVRRAIQHREASRWAGLEMSVAGAADAVCVCTADDARRFPSAVVVPNGYDPPARPLGRTAARRPPTFLFAGMLTYPPNVDAARRLVGEVGPRLRAIVPDARIRLVGRTDEKIDALAHPPEVVVTGWVPGIDSELAEADVVIVPIRYGSGTRIKIIEAFAHRIPVVATAAAVAGLGARSEEHLLLAETAADLASAGARLVQDTALRRGLCDRAEAFFLANFTTDAVQKRIRQVAQTVAAGRTWAENGTTP